MIRKRNKKRYENEKKRSFNDRFQKRLTTLPVRQAHGDGQN